MRGRRVVLTVFCLILAMTPISARAQTMTTLGTDASGDAPVGADLLSLQVATRGRALHVRMAMALLPEVGSIPGAGIQWAFSSRGRIYVAEAHQGEPGDYSFTLYEWANETFNTLSAIEGEVDATAGTIDVFVPFNLIGAKRGTAIVGTPISDIGDVEVHYHTAAATEILDEFSTSQGFKIR
jgi:hypothetical protein